MSEFLTTVRTKAREKHPESFLGVEEPCEAYIPMIDIVHGRAFTDTRWPAAAPGGVSIPLYVYLYHEYQLNYAGWIDKKFSPFGDVRFGIGRATIFGMQPGVRIGQGPFEYTGGDPSAELAMLRDAVQLMDRCSRYLLLGRMVHDPEIDGGPNIGFAPTDDRASLPVPWPLVQATTWRSDDGSICYALVNLSDETRTVNLNAVPHGMPEEGVQIKRISADAEVVLHDRVRLPMTVPVKLGPWEICCLEQVALL
jgi:hypothetical protein